MQLIIKRVLNVFPKAINFKDGQNFNKYSNFSYTSIGDITNTVPNPHLKFITEDGTESYLPAYKLVDPTDQWERQGRLK